ncbi:MAG: hypothetical protein ACTSO2_19110 [Promethearchaeota archaeon]
MNNKIFEQFMDRIGVVVPWSLIDEVVISNANILRPVKGHAFEILFDEIVRKYLKCQFFRGPRGDTDIDRILINKSGNKITMQLKTCAVSTIKENIKFGVSLHKTHGLEKRPRNLYPIKWPCPLCPHDGEEFPDFLIILHPKNGILIVPKDRIPESKTYRGHYADPAMFDWDSEFLNRWDLLGFDEFLGKSLERRSVPPQKKLPKIAQIVKLTDEEIVQMWLMPENFRTLEMNLKGNLREPALANWLRENNISATIPTKIAYPKYDIITKNGTRIQIKGISRGLCNLDKNIIGVEVMGSHRQGPERMYSDGDFDFLGLVIDPPYIPNNINLDREKYHFCLISLSELPLHYKNEEWGTIDKIYPNCKFIIFSTNEGCFLKPSDNYNVPIYFRGHGPWPIDKIPENLLF